VGQALDDPSTHDEVRADHDRVTGLGGWGVPTLVFGGAQALFGPVLIDPPAGEAAIRWPGGARIRFVQARVRIGEDDKARGGL
jgi:hypothetical protein